jgi:hypothetical protein
MEHLLEIEQVTGEKIPEEFMGKELSERFNRKREKLLSTFSIKRKDVFTLDVREIPFCLRSNIYFFDTKSGTFISDCYYRSRQRSFP